MNGNPPSPQPCGRCYGTCACSALRGVADFLREEAAADLAEGKPSRAAENLATADELDRGV
ncbi:hypothetical protein NE236_25460 [Actinoallomurus purpureus]|uniref:hypothetical protein n=1 Tax=Actinoallomurus purpureus TaxID=478114 RepID=UPI002092D33A|nr:hypothetical protein [Actinoallomurus purpureus]MCO6008330.1 hypothetical protein [Actinoallomurus purpureus]